VSVLSAVRVTSTPRSDLPSIDISHLVVERDAGEEEADERHALCALVEDVVLECTVRLLPSAPPQRCAACCDVVAAEGDGWAGAGVSRPSLREQAKRASDVRRRPVLRLLASLAQLRARSAHAILLNTVSRSLDH
jgi:hypothetical protein